jgi:glycosyltransferase involved in cell wall biosynthesis
MWFNYFTILFGIISGLILFFHLPCLSLNSQKKSSSKIKLSIIIPARNEENNLPNILSDLNKQTYEIHEIICVDDHSEDNSEKIIKQFKVKYISAKKLPHNWKGKTWACQNGASHATGDLLLFIDADVRLEKHAIESLITKYEKTHKPISIQPYHTVRKQHEFFSLFFNMIQISSTAMSFVNKSINYGFYGPILLIPKTLFDKYEGYVPVKNNVVEDFNLGKFYNKNGISIDLLLGYKSIQFQMYPDKFSQVIEGWTKNFSTGSISTKFWLLFLNIYWIAYLTILPIELVLNYLNSSFFTFAILCLIYIFSVLFIYRLAKKIGSYPFYVCLFYPVYLLIFHLIFLYSIFATFFLKSTTWKGRKL